MAEMPESLVWLEQINAVQAQLQKNPAPSRADLKTTLQVSDTQLTSLLRISGCLDPAAIEKIRQAALGDNAYGLSFKSALALAGLKGKVADLPTTFHAALDLVLTRRLATRHIKALVDWIVSGKPAAEFESTKAKRLPSETVQDLKVTTPPQTELHQASKSSAPSPARTQKAKIHFDPDKLVELAKQAALEEAQGNGQTTQQDALKAYLAQIKSATDSSVNQESVLSNRAPHLVSSGQTLNTGETVILDAMAGVSILAKVKAKLKKGEKPTTAEYFLLVGYRLWTALHWLGKNGFKLAKWLMKEIWKFSKDNLKALRKTWIGTIFKYACIIFIVWFAWSAYTHGILYPFRVVGGIIAHHWKWDDTSHPDPSANVGSNANSSSSELAQLTPVPQPVASAQTQPKPVARLKSAQQAASYIPAQMWTEENENANQFEAELAALPNYCRISDYAVAPDNTMAGDMAYRRLSDLSNSDEYSMKIGGGTQKVLNVQVSTTNLTINYQNDINSLFGGSLKMDFYWEDVKSAHCDLVTPFEANKKPFYQLTVLVNDAKHPLIVQCSKALDMQRLVSALDNYLRAARLQPLALGGLPYPLQGLRLNDKNEVTLLWADSPAGKAGLKLKDIVWSFEKNLANPTENKLLQAQLRTLTPGSHPLYLVKQADWNKAQIAQSMGQANRFNPKRQKVDLVAP